MHHRAALVTDIEAAEAMQPGERPFDDPACGPEATAVRGLAAGQDRENAAGAELVTMPFRVVPAVALHTIRSAPGASARPAERRDGVDERQQLGDVVAVRRGEDGDQGNPARLGQKVMLRPFLAAIGWVRSSFFPPRSARRDALSTRARVRSSSPRRCSSVSSTAWSRFQTPAFCQRTKRRQQVVPEPQPISRGSMFQGMPLRSTNRIPVTTARSGMRGRPARCPRPRRGRGRSGSMCAHSASSSKRGGDMRDRTNSAAQVQELS